MTASSIGRVETVALLLDRKAEPNLQDEVSAVSQSMIVCFTCNCTLGEYCN